MIGPENSHHSLTQQVASLEPITTLSLAFNFLCFGQFGCFYSEFSWALKGNFLTSDGRCDDFGFGFCDTQSKSARIKNVTKATNFSLQ